MNAKKMGYIISIGVLILTVFFGCLIIKNNNKLVYTKKDSVKVNKINTRTDEILNELKELKKDQKKELDKNGESKRYYKISDKIDKLNSERANLDMELDVYNQKKVKDYKKMIPGIMLIIFGLIISIMVFIKTKKMNDNQLTNSI